MYLHCPECGSFMYQDIKPEKNKGIGLCSCPYGCFYGYYLPNGKVFADLTNKSEGKENE